MTVNQIITWIIVGGVAGFIIDSVLRGNKVGLLGAVFIGILGGLAGGWLFEYLHIRFVVGTLGDIITSFIGAVVVLVLLRYLRKI